MPGLGSMDVDGRLVVLRAQLEDMFRGLHLAHEEVCVCADAAREEGQPQLATVLHLSVCNRIYGELKVLTNIVEALGGKTEISTTDIQSGHPRRSR
jgi:hypothetical protein